MKAFILYIKEPNSLKYAKECVDSCIKHNLDYELVEGYLGKTYDELMSYKLGYPIKHFEDPHSEWGRHGNAICGHIKIYNKIVEYGRPAALLEHDVIVKRNFNNLQIPEDNNIYYISIKVYNRNHYTPSEEDYSYTTLPNGYYFDGNNAKILSPTSAKFILNYYANMVDYDDFNKIYKEGIVKQIVVDPIPTVNECGDRMSTVVNSHSHVSNTYIPLSFYKNLSGDNLIKLYKDSACEIYY